MPSRTFKRLALTSAIAIGLLAIGVGQASAHVTVVATDAVRGGSDVAITFRAPTESDTASTIELQVALPTDTPLASVLVQPVPGWKSTVTSVKLATPIKTDDGNITQAVSTVDWKANSVADGFKPGEFGQFTVIAGKLPDTATLTFKAIQTYSDKSVVKWIDVNAPGSTANLDHPAPVLTLAAPAATASAATASAAPSSSASSSALTATAAPKSAASKTSVTVAIVIAAVAVVLAIGGLAAGISGRRS